jgi:hypothetical protein
MDYFFIWTDFNLFILASLVFFIDNLFRTTGWKDRVRRFHRILVFFKFQFSFRFGRFHWWILILFSLLYYGGVSLTFLILVLGEWNWALMNIDIGWLGVAWRYSIFIDHHYSLFLSSISLLSLGLTFFLFLSFLKSHFSLFIFHPFIFCLDTRYSLLLNRTFFNPTSHWSPCSRLRHTLYSSRGALTLFNLLLYNAFPLLVDLLLPSLPVYFKNRSDVR